MSREEFAAKLKQLQEIGEGKFRNNAVDKQLAKVDRATDAVDRMASRIEGKQGSGSALVAPMVSPIVQSVSGVNGTVTSASASPNQTA
jgi:hypothetical protein